MQQFVPQWRRPPERATSIPAPRGRPPFIVSKKRLNRFPFGLSSLHRDHLTEWRMPASRRSPQDRIGRSGLQKRSAEIGQEDERLWLNTVFVAPIGIWPK